MKRTIVMMLIAGFVLTQTGTSYALRQMGGEKAAANGLPELAKSAVAPAAGKVLIVNSDTALSKYLEMTMLRNGWETETAVTVDEAMPKITGKDLVITGWRLANPKLIEGTEPDGQGKALVNAIKNMDEKTRPAIIVYTVASEDVNETGFKGFRVLDAMASSSIQKVVGDVMFEKKAPMMNVAVVGVDESGFNFATIQEWLAEQGFNNTKITAITEDQIEAFKERGDWMIIQWVGDETGFRIITAAGNISISKTTTESMDEFKQRFQSEVKTSV